MPTKTRHFKMEWAKIHLDTLNNEFASLASNPEKFYRITPNEDAKRDIFTIKTELVGAIYVIQLGLIASDYINNLRSSLDHIAWELAGIGKKRRSSETCFPVCIRDTPRTQTQIDAATAGIPSQAVSIMKSFQPYIYGKAYKSHPLWRLNFLWNISKHRDIGLHSFNSSVLFEIPPGIRVKERKFRDETEVTIPLSAKDKVRFNPRPNLEVLFGDKERGVKLSIQELRDIYEFVSREVWPALAHFIP